MDETDALEAALEGEVFRVDRRRAHRRILD